NEESFYGYKNHVSVDRKHKIIRRYAETDASVHDSQKLDAVLDKSNTSNEVWADSAYRSAETEAKLKQKRWGGSVSLNRIPASLSGTPTGDKRSAGQFAS